MSWKMQMTWQMKQLQSQKVMKLLMMNDSALKLLSFGLFQLDPYLQLSSSTNCVFIFIIIIYIYIIIIINQEHI